MRDYHEIDELCLFYLEDSWVLDVEARPGVLTMSLDVVLLPEHPDYRAPLPGELYCYRRGELKFEGVSSVDWVGQGRTPARDASGEIDHGGVDSFVLDQGVYRMSGDFGVISVQAASLRMVLFPVQE